MRLTVPDIARMMDFSAVQAESSEEDVRDLARWAKECQCAAAFALPSQTPLVAELLADEPAIAIGGVVGFPSGGTTAESKAREAEELLRMGCGELDMVINVGMLRSRRNDRVEDDIRRVVDAAKGAPVKVILECHHLSDDEIRTGCELSVKAGAAWVKTGTGWAPTGATLENVALIRSCVGDAVGIKAAGGVRGLETLVEMYRRGARRFGVGTGSAVKILQQCATRSGGFVEF
jgi:deoxyribose-phosphate aldolase